MAAQQRNLETIADNLANAGVVGFKGSAQRFAELVAPGGRFGTLTLGARVFFKQGKLARSAGPFDVAIDGPGFFAVVDSHGRRYYTRDGQFSRAADGTLRGAHDLRLDGIRIPANALTATVLADGTVQATFASGPAHAVGRIRLAEFAAPEALRAVDGALFAGTREAGAVRTIVAGGDDAPKLRFGMLEESNVTIIDAMMQILTAQRAYEANAKGVQAADEMLRIANNLQRT